MKIIQDTKADQKNRKLTEHYKLTM